MSKLHHWFKSYDSFDRPGTLGDLSKHKFISVHLQPRQVVVGDTFVKGVYFSFLKIHMVACLTMV